MSLSGIILLLLALLVLKKILGVSNFLDQAIARWDESPMPLKVFTVAGIVLAIGCVGIIALRKPTERAVADSPTRLRLVYHANDEPPTADRVSNIFRWYALKIQSAAGMDRAGAPALGWFVFLTFDKAIDPSALTLTVTIFADPKPSYEVKDFCPRSAIIAIVGRMPAGSIEISAERAPIDSSGR